MSFLPTCISIAVILWCLFLSGYVTSGDSENCYQGYTGPESGGSCTFNSCGFCNYEDTNHGAKWEVNTKREAFANMHGKDEGNRAVLTSPWMCEENITTICIQFNFMFSCRDGGRLTLKLCHDTTECDDVWFANSGDTDEWKWQQARRNIALKLSGWFQIQFEGKKTNDRWFKTETNFYLDKIIYNNASCFTDLSSAPAPTSDDLLSTSGETVTTDTSTVLHTTSPDEDNNKEHHNAYTDEEDSSKLRMITTILAVLLLTAAVVAVVLYFRRQRAHGDAGSQKRSIRKDHRGSVVMVNNDLYCISGPAEAAQHTEESIPLQETGTPQDHDTYYSMVHTMNPDPDLGVLVVHGHDNPSGSENYENVTLDKK